MCVAHEHLSSKKWSNLNFLLLILVSYIEFDIYYAHGFFLWKIGFVAYGLRSFSIWGFCVWPDFGDRTYGKLLVNFFGRNKP